MFGAARHPRSLLTTDKIQNIELDSADRDQKEQKDRASEGSSGPGEIVSNVVSNNSSIRLFKSPLALE